MFNISKTIVKYCINTYLKKCLVYEIKTATSYYYDNLYVFVRLAGDTIDAAINSRFRIIYRNNHTY